jgi:hypothetical protein
MKKLKFSKSFGLNFKDNGVISQILKGKKNESFHRQKLTKIFENLKYIIVLSISSRAQ